MMSLELSMTGMQLELQGGQAGERKAPWHVQDEARRAEGDLPGVPRDRRKYFVDAEVFALVDKLDAALKVSPPDGKLAGDLGQRIAPKAAAGATLCTFSRLRARTVAAGAAAQ